MTIFVQPTASTSDSYFNSKRWRRWKNMSGTTCPAYGLVSFAPIEEDGALAPTGSTPGELELDGYRATDWSSRQQSHVFLGANSGMPVVPGGTGLFTQDWPARLLIDVSTSANNRTRQTHLAGPKPDSWYVWESGAAFRIGRTLNTSDLPLLGSKRVVEVWPFDHPMPSVLYYEPQLPQTISPLDPIFGLNPGSEPSLLTEDPGTIHVDSNNGRFFPNHRGIYTGFVQVGIGTGEVQELAGIYFTVERSDGTLVRQLPEQGANQNGAGHSLCVPFCCELLADEGLTPRLFGDDDVLLSARILMNAMRTETHPLLPSFAAGP